MRATATSMSAARRLRRRLSLPEMLLWRLLRFTRRELRFRRQHPIGTYVAHFYCPAAKIVIEVDGATHAYTQDTVYDRVAYMAALGLKVMRISAADVLADPEAVADAIYRLCEASAAGPSPAQPRG